MQKNDSELHTIASTRLYFEISQSNEDNKKNLVILRKDGFSKYLEVNNLTLSVLFQINKQKTFYEIFNKLKIDFKLSGSVEELFLDFKETKLFKYIFDSNADFKATRGDKYIFPKLTILKKEWVQFLSTPFIFLFKDWIFITLFLLMPLILVIFYISNDIDVGSLYNYINTENGLTFYIGYLLCVLFHELGHAASAIHYKTQPDNIGFGFYLISPVFYCDVSDIWRLNNKKRFRVDLGGIYFQWILSLIFIGIFFIRQQEFWLYFSFFNFVSSLFNLNPLLRYDGYWAVSDLLQVPNLRQKSLREFKSLLKELIQLKFVKRSSRNYFVALYGFLSAAMIGSFLYFMVFIDTNSTIYFFKNLGVFLYEILFETTTITFDYVKTSIISFLPSIIFYYLLFNFFKSRIKTWKSH